MSQRLHFVVISVAPAPQGRHRLLVARISPPAPESGLVLAPIPPQSSQRPGASASAPPCGHGSSASGAAGVPPSLRTPILPHPRGEQRARLFLPMRQRLPSRPGSSPRLGGRPAAGTAVFLPDTTSLPPHRRRPPRRELEPGR